MTSRSRGVAAVLERSDYASDGDPNGIVKAQSPGDTCSDYTNGTMWIALASGTDAWVGVGSSEPGGAIVDLTSAPYSVTADGTDMTTAIQDANDALAAAGGGILQLPRGVVTLDTLILDTRVRYQGYGPGISVLKQKAGATGNFLEGRSFATLTGGTGNGGPTQFSLRDFTVDANKAACPDSSRGIAVYGPEFTIFNLHVMNAVGDGVFIEFRGDSSSKYDAHVILNEVYAAFMKIQSCGSGGGSGPFSAGGNGLWVFGEHDSCFLHVDTGFCGAGSGSATGGIRAENNGVHFTACHNYGTQQDYAWNLRGQSFLVDCVGEGAKTAQFYVAFDEVNIKGGTAYYPGDNAANAVKFNGTPDHVHIDGLYIEKGGSSFDFAPAIDFTAAGTDMTLKAKINQATGVAWSGTPPTDAILEISVAGGATGGNLYQQPNAPWALGALPQVISDRFVAADTTVPDVTKWTRAVGGGAGASLQTLTNRMKFIAGSTGLSNVADDVTLKALLDTSPIDGELLFSLVVGDATHESYFYAGLRCQAVNPFRSTDSYFFQFGTNAVGVQNVYCYKKVASVLTQLYTTGGSFAQLIVGAKMWVRLRVRGSHIQMKYWNDGVTEPSSWQLDTTDTGVTGVGFATFALSSGVAAAVNPTHSLDDVYISAL